MNKIMPIIVTLMISIFTFGCTSEDSSISYNFSENNDRYWEFSENLSLEPVTLAENVPYVEIFEDDTNEVIARFIASGEMIEVPYSNVSIIQDFEVDNPTATKNYENNWVLYIPNGKILDLR